MHFYTGETEQSQTGQPQGLPRQRMLLTPVRLEGQWGAGAHRTWRAAFPPGPLVTVTWWPKHTTGGFDPHWSCFTFRKAPAAKPGLGRVCSSGTSPLIAPLMGSLQRGDADARDLLSWMESKEVFCHPVMGVQDIVNATL